MRLALASLLALLTLTSACTHKRVAPHVKPTQLAPTPAAALASNETYDWIKYDELGCDVRWNEYCREDYELVAPDGWSVCRPLFTVTHAGRGGPTFRDFVTRLVMTDPPPRRFLGIRFEMRAKGSGERWNRWGSNITVQNIGLRLIRFEATRAERSTLNCY